MRRLFWFQNPKMGRATRRKPRRFWRAFRPLRSLGLAAALPHVRPVPPKQAKREGGSLGSKSDPVLHVRFPAPWSVVANFAGVLLFLDHQRDAVTAGHDTATGDRPLLPQHDLFVRFAIVPVGGYFKGGHALGIQQGV